MVQDMTDFPPFGSGQSKAPAPCDAGAHYRGSD